MLAYPARLLFGDDTAKHVFKTSKESGIPRLYSERHIAAADHRYWVQFTTVFDSADDVCATLTVPELRRAAEEAPENIVTLVEVLTLHLESLVDDTHFAPVPPYNPGGFSALFASTAPPRPVDARNRVREALNCCRVLMRVVPVIYESTPRKREDSDIDDLEQRTLWTPLPRTRFLRNERGRSSPTKETPEEEAGAKASDQFIITDGDEGDLSTQDPLSAMAPGSGADGAGEPVMTGHALLNTLLDLLFHSGFTMPWTDEQLNSTTSNDISRVHFTIWESGIGCTVNLQGTTARHLDHRIEVLRLLVALLSKPIYTAPDEPRAGHQHAREYVACALERPVVLSFLCSLLNTVANYSQGDHWMPLTSAADPQRDALTSLCLQVLCALLTYEPPDTSGLGGAEQRNLFLFYMTKLYRMSDFAFLATGTAKMFHLAMTHTRGPFELGAASGSLFVKACEEHVSEMLVILWLLLRHNAHFRNYIVGNRQLSLDMLSWLLYIALTNKDAPPSLAQAQLALFVLQDLTSDRTFCVHLTSLQSAADLTVPTRLLRLTGSVAMDALIESVFVLLTRSAGLMAPMYTALLLILDNTAPFWRNLSLSSAARLEQMLLQLASPRFLLASEQHPQLIAILLDAFTRMVREQFATNANVVYVLVRAAPVIERLESLTFPAALEYVHKQRERARSEAPANTAKPLPSAPQEGPVVDPSVAQASGAPADAPREAESRPAASTESTGDTADKAEAAGHDPAAMPDVADPLGAESAAPSASDAEPLGSDLGNASTTDAQDEAPANAEPEEPAKTESEQAPTKTESEQAPAKTESEQTPTKTESEQTPTKTESEQTQAPQADAADTTATDPAAVPPTPPMDAGLEEIARTVGKNGFVPTAAWFDAWHRALDIRTLRAVLDDLVPRVNAYCAQPEVTNSNNPDERVLAFLREQKPAEAALQPAELSYG
ncbi:hypothetical protein MBRA1_003172 [Malassezia brasiliensis]|uniref:Dymeclin n=1 Tax=Malassezia brasiliensis TaxID=1821822 RepID=A0AAF0IQY5_9BASI|nr:hypothetical protein MBRA1_003172 [Malassezia brasiliensis]